MTKKLLMGNEAFAHAALEAGVRVVAGYPGTPSSEVTETVAKLHASGAAQGIHVEWSTNEKSALELLAGASYCGARTLFTCKQVGLNVASDPLLSLNYVGVKGGTVLFVGTKKQAQESVAEAANRCGMPYVNARWLGGMLTNFTTIRSRVQRMEELEAMEADGRMELLPKKEQILLKKELAKLQTNLNGIRNMKKTPDMIFIIDTNREQIAIHESHRLNIPVVGTLDTNCDPDDVDFGIPANDDAIRSVRLLAEFVADAVIAGTGAPVTVEDMTAEPAAEAAAEATPAE